MTTEPEEEALADCPLGRLMALRVVGNRWMHDLTREVIIQHYVFRLMVMMYFNFVHS